MDKIILTLLDSTTRLNVSSKSRPAVCWKPLATNLSFFPDLNILDLGFLSAIQSLQQKDATKLVDELIEVVQKSFDAFSSNDSNKILRTLQSCMIEIMKVRGNNNYKILHM